MFEPPRGTHYFLGAGVGPVTVDELMAEHHIEVVNLAGQGRRRGRRAQRARVARRAARRVRGHASVTLAQTRPDADDVEGWIALLGDGGDEAAEARDALELIERKARANKQWDTVVEVLLGRIEHAEASERAAALLRSPQVYETEVGDLRRAFEAVDDRVSDRARRRRRRRRWPRSSPPRPAAGPTSSPRRRRSRPRRPIRTLASKWWARLGGWYAQKLDRADYALPSLRRALELDAHNRAAYVALADAHRKQQKWADLADTLRAHADDRDRRRDQGRSPDRPRRSSARASSRRPRRRSRPTRRPPISTTTLRRRARRARAAVPPRREVGEPREGARPPRRDQRGAGRHRPRRRDPPRARDAARREARRSRGRDRALRGRGRRATAATPPRSRRSSISTTRPAAPRTTCARWSGSARSRPRARSWRRCASSPPSSRTATRRAREAYEKLLAADPSADDAYRGLERVLRPRRTGTSWSRVHRRHIAAVKTPAQRVELYLESAQIYERELDDAAQAIDCLMNVARDRREQQDRARRAAAAVRRGSSSTTARSTRWSRSTPRSTATSASARRSTPRPAGSRSST